MWRSDHRAGVCLPGQHQHGPKAGGCQWGPPETPGAAGGDGHGGRLPERDSGTVSQSELSLRARFWARLVGGGGPSSPSLHSVSQSLRMRWHRQPFPSSLVQCSSPAGTSTGLLGKLRDCPGLTGHSAFIQQTHGAPCVPSTEAHARPMQSRGRSDPEGIVCLALRSFSLLSA